MRCQSCGDTEATVVVTKIVSETHQVVHLCAACANTLAGPGGVAITLQGLRGAGAPPPGFACPSCGKTFAEFSKSGLFGCADCYEAFEPQLERLFRRVQGVGSHDTGAVPPGERLSDLEHRLQEAVSHEAFEEAALLRDRIEKLKTGTAI